MALTDTLGGFFGGSTKSEGAQIAPTQLPFLKDLYQRAQLESFNNQGQQFSQQFQQPSFNAFQNLAQGGAQTDLTGLQQLAQGGQFDQFQNQQNPALQGAIGAGLRQINQNFNENILPGINTGSALSGTSGGSRQGIAQGIAARGANNTAADFVNKMQAQNFNQIQNRNLQATSAGVQNQLGAFQGLGQFAGQQNQAQNAALGQANNLSNLGFGAQFGNLNALSGLIGSPTVLGGGSQQQGGIGSTIGGVGTLLSGVAALSDERAKENIKKVGKLDNGLDVYAYNYKGQSVTQIGVMAQEVEEVMPEAVVEYMGLKHVRYDMATQVSDMITARKEA